MKIDKRRNRCRKRKCRNCGELYKPDPRTRKKQKYCSAPKCRKASQAASWRRWHDKPENRDYDKGAVQVEQTREWRRKNPGYWKRGRKSGNALPNESGLQVVDIQSDRTSLATGALPNEMFLQPAMVVGLIASLTGSALPNEIAESSRRFLLLGHDILGIGSGMNPKGGRDDDKTSYMSATLAESSETVQLGGSPPG